MKVDGFFDAAPANAAATAAHAEAAGYDAAWTAETSHDPLIASAVAAGATERIELGTSITVAFARTPMTLAYAANDVQLLSGGRFILGLGSQIKPHIEQRFAMPWSSPGPRMREFVTAMREIWAAWQEGTKLAFRGDFYTHTRMTPFFDPGPNPHGPPKVYLAGVGELMTEVAGEVCDGFICHGFTTERYLREVTLPALEQGRAKTGQPLEGFEISAPSFVVTGETEEQFAAARAGTKQQIAFYGSTPAYRPVLELHGWGDAQDELNSLSKEGKWVEMADVIDDEMLAAFAVVGEPDDIAPELIRRYGDVATRVTFYAPYTSNQEHWDALWSNSGRPEP